ncbi:putative methyltransferase-domain-containing protein [Gorgonomyces haynaldii]|nr:putative methyltransferase-domain-containing protein [Gorgonomyces haynaldii]
MRNVSRETNQFTDDIISCDRRNLDQVTEMLTRLEELVNIHLEAEKHKFIYQDDKMLEMYQTVQENGLEQLQKLANPWLIQLLNRPPNMPMEEETQFLDRVSAIMSHLCGKVAHGPSTTQFTFNNIGTVSIHETTYTEAEIGFQTWGAGILLSKILDEEELDVKGKTVLELGSGTGLAGLVCALCGAKSTWMTDYHPTVLDNLERNVKLNNLEDKIVVKKLDWRTCLDPEQQDPSLKETEFDLVIAADCIFDFEHSRLVPKVSMHYLSKKTEARFHVVITYRLKFKLEVAQFEENMLKEGWTIEKTRYIERHAIAFRYSVYKR